MMRNDQNTMPASGRIQVMLEQQRRGFWSLDGVVDAVFSTVRNAKQNQGRAIGMDLVVAFHGHHLGRLVLQRVQAVQVAQHDLQRRDEGRHRHGHREHDARAQIDPFPEQKPSADAADDEGGGEVQPTRCVPAGTKNLG